MFKKQFIKFLLISGTGWIIDFAIYLILTEIFKLKIFYANILSSVPAISFVFFLSTKKIFKKNQKKITINQKYIIYIVYQIILIFLISFLADFLYLFVKNRKIDFEYLKVTIKILITPITMIVNFFVLKYLAEKV